MANAIKWSRRRRRRRRGWTREPQKVLTVMTLVTEERELQIWDPAFARGYLKCTSKVETPYSSFYSLLP